MVGNKSYNLALISMNNNNFINTAQKLAPIAYQYLIGPNSWPHVTLCRFTASEREIKAIWINAQSLWSKPFIYLEFKTISCITHDGLVYWPSLLPSKVDEIINFHNQLSKVIRQPSNPSFDPHLTLLNTKHPEWRKALAEFKSTYQPLSDDFTLALCESDSIGQVTHIIYSCG